MNQNIVTVAAIFTTFVAACVINFYGVEEKDVGEVYTYSYSKCVQWNSGAKGVSWCAKYVPASEQRINTVKEGLFFNDNSYRIVK